MELTVEKLSLVYCPSDENRKAGQAIGVGVEFHFLPGNPRALRGRGRTVSANRTDYTVWFLEIWTGRVRLTPDDALNAVPRRFCASTSTCLSVTTKNAIEFEEAADKQGRRSQSKRRNCSR